MHTTVVISLSLEYCLRYEIPGHNMSGSAATGSGDFFHFAITKYFSGSTFYSPLNTTKEFVLQLY